MVVARGVSTRTWCYSGLLGDDVIHRDDEGTIARGDLARVIPLNIASCAVPNVDGLPKRIVTGVKGSSGRVELV